MKARMVYLSVQFQVTILIPLKTQRLQDKALVVFISKNKSDKNSKSISNLNQMITIKILNKSVLFNKILVKT
jgi:hypothetical protein